MKFNKIILKINKFSIKKHFNFFKFIEKSTKKIKHYKKNL